MKATRPLSLLRAGQCYQSPLRFAGGFARVQSHSRGPMQRTHRSFEDGTDIDSFLRSLKNKAPVFSDDEVPVVRNEYVEAESVQSRSMEDVSEFLKENGITINGSAPKPLQSYEESGFPEEILNTIRASGYEKPTPIQCQGWPLALSGSDMIGVSATGSGKTQGFVLPGLIHVSNQPPLTRGDGPLMLVLSPTRELAVQIDREVTRFAENMRIRNCAVYGGQAKHVQLRELRRGAHVVTATPGRLVDLLSARQLSLSRVSYLVMDEADRMLDMGFEPQLRAILGQIRPERQTLMWSATWPREIQSLAAEYLNNPVRITIGNEKLSANVNVRQVFKFVAGDTERMWNLADSMRAFKEEQGREGKYIVFCQTKRRVDEVTAEMQSNGIYAASIHGDKHQNERDATLAEFRRITDGVLVATDVAARGLDVKDIDVVVNYDLPHNVEDYIHRIGRTARAGQKGTAVSMYEPAREGAKFARDLGNVLRRTGHALPKEIADFARQRGGRGTSYGSSSNYSGRGGFNSVGKNVGGFHGARRRTPSSGDQRRFR